MLGEERNGYVRFHMLYDAAYPLGVRKLFLANPTKIIIIIINRNKNNNIIIQKEKRIHVLAAPKAHFYFSSSVL